MPDPIVLRYRVLGETGGEIGVMTETVQVAGAQRAGAAGVDGDDDVEMLIFGEIPADHLAATGRGLPVDHVLRIAGAIIA